MRCRLHIKGIGMAFSMRPLKNHPPEKGMPLEVS